MERGDDTTSAQLHQELTPLLHPAYRQEASVDLLRSLVSAPPHAHVYQLLDEGSCLLFYELSDSRMVLPLPSV
jgi:hypothetical protein